MTIMNNFILHVCTIDIRQVFKSITYNTVYKVNDYITLLLIYFDLYTKQSAVCVPFIRF